MCALNNRDLLIRGRDGLQGRDLTFRVFYKKRHPVKLQCTFFTRKFSNVIFIVGGEALSRWQNYKTSNIE